MSHDVPQALASPIVQVDDRPWYRQVNRTQWTRSSRRFSAGRSTAFDFTIISFLIVDMQQQLHGQQGAGGRARHGDAVRPRVRRDRRRNWRRTDGGARAR